jgi:uncharacterized OB-fold protein
MTMTESFGEVRRGVFPNMRSHAGGDWTTDPFWEAARQGKLSVPKCTNCGTFRLPPYFICYVCQSEGVEWVELTGTGTVYSFTVTRHAFHPDLAAVVPYVSAIVELDGTQGEGARLLVNVIDCDPDAIRIGDAVKIIFDDNDDMPTPRATPISEEEK